MRLWLEIESVPEQPITQSLNPTYAWLIHQTTSILLPPSRHRTHAHTHVSTLAHTHADTMYPNPSRSAHEHTGSALSIMVNISNSISFLDSWSLDRHASDSLWFLSGSLSLQLPHFLYSLWSLFEGGYRTCCQNRFTYILPFFFFL